MNTTHKPRRFTRTAKQHAVWMVQRRRPEFSSEWATMRAIAEEIGASGESVRSWTRKAIGSVSGEQAHATPCEECGDLRAKLTHSETMNDELFKLLVLAHQASKAA